MKQVTTLETSPTIVITIENDRYRKEEMMDSYPDDDRNYQIDYTSQP